MCGKVGFMYVEGRAYVVRVCEIQDYRHEINDVHEMFLVREIAAHRVEVEHSDWSLLE